MQKQLQHKRVKDSPETTRGLQIQDRFCLVCKSYSCAQAPIAIDGVGDLNKNDKYRSWHER